MAGKAGLARLLRLVLLLAWAGRAGAHVAPSADANNRYAKVTVLPDRVRVAYTVYFGERPGAAERRRMDTNGDGAIDEGEAHAFGERVAGTVTPALAVTVDGRARAGWTLTDVGLGTPLAAAGAFSLDFVLYAPLDDGAAHTVSFDDGWQAPQPGEAEVRVEESPGVQVVEAHLRKGESGVVLYHLFTGNPGAAGERAIDARFVVAAPPPRPRSRLPRWPLYALGVALVVVGLAGALWRGRARGGRLP